MSRPISQLSENLKKEVDKNNHGLLYHGLLYHAIKLVAEADGKWKEAYEFLKSKGISPQTSLNDEKKILIEQLYFPRDFTIEPPKSKSILFTVEHPETFTIYILIASWIVSSLKEKTFQQNPVEKNIAQETINKASSLPAFKNLTLALVIKGKELQDIQRQASLSLDVVIKLLENASYFLCIYQHEMPAIQKELTLDNGEIDRESEQLILVIMHFEHTPALSHGKTFANKLELTQYLNEGSVSFKVDNIQILIKMSGLSKLGFIRT